MSLCISTVTPEGIVLAADSRQSYRNLKNVSRIGSDSATKVFKIGDRMGLAIAGLAFLPEEGVQKNMSRFVEEFRDGLVAPNMTVAETAERLKAFFEKKYDYREQLKSRPNLIKADLERQGLEYIDHRIEKGHVAFRFKDKQGNTGEGISMVDQLQFILAGYDKDNSHQVYMVYIPGESEKPRDSRVQGAEYGANWIGQTDVVTRIVLGFDPRITNLPLVQQAAKTPVDQQLIQNQLAGLEYVIQWGTMTLQDGIDFSVLAIETTKALQRFSDGIRADPGDVPGVGGPIDVAIITADGFRWATKKAVKIGTQDSTLLQGIV